MASPIVESYRAKSEICRGEGDCKNRLAELLKDHGLPVGIIPVDDLEELGYNNEDGFIWVVRKKRRDHYFKAIKQLVSYATEVTAQLEPRKIKKMTGVTTREMLLWLSVVEVYIGDPSSGKITFKTGTGLSDSFPVSAFEQEE